MIPKTKRQTIPQKFQMPDSNGLYCIRHHPTNSIYVGMTTSNLKRRMRTHISNLRNEKHPCLLLQSLFTDDPNLDNWSAQLLYDSIGETKEEMHSLESELVSRIHLEKPHMVILNTNKNRSPRMTLVKELIKRLEETK